MLVSRRDYNSSLYLTHQYNTDSILISLTISYMQNAHTEWNIFTTACLPKWSGQLSEEHAGQSNRPRVSFFQQCPISMSGMFSEKVAINFLPAQETDYYGSSNSVHGIALYHPGTVSVWSPHASASTCTAACSSPQPRPMLTLSMPYTLLSSKDFFFLSLEQTVCIEKERKKRKKGKFSSRRDRILRAEHVVFAPNCMKLSTNFKLILLFSFWHKFHNMVMTGHACIDCRWSSKQDGQPR